MHRHRIEAAYFSLAISSEQRVGVIARTADWRQATCKFCSAPDDVDEDSQELLAATAEQLCQMLDTEPEAVLAEIDQWSNWLHLSTEWVAVDYPTVHEAVESLFEYNLSGRWCTVVEIAHAATNVVIGAVATDPRTQRSTLRLLTRSPISCDVDLQNIQNQLQNTAQLLSPTDFADWLAALRSPLRAREPRFVQVATTLDQTVSAVLSEPSPAYRQKGRYAAAAAGM